MVAADRGKRRHAGQGGLIDDGRCCGDEVEVVLALEAGLHHVHVQQPQEAAPASERASERRKRGEREKRKKRERKEKERDKREERDREEKERGERARRERERGERGRERKRLKHGGVSVAGMLSACCNQSKGIRVLQS